MVGAAAVVPDAAPELGEGEHHHIVGHIMRAQVGVEIADGAAQIGQQPGVNVGFAGVGVVAPLLGVENPRAQVGGQHFGDALQVAGNARVGVFHAGGVLLGGGLEDVGAFEGVQAGLPQVVHSGAQAHGGGVHPGENVQRLGAFRFAGYARQHAVGFQHGHGGHGDARQGHGPGQAASEVDAGQHIFGAGVQVADDAAQPALRADLFGLAGVPDVHAAEVGTVGRGVADAVDDGHLAGVVQRLDFGQGGVEGKMVVDGQGGGGGDAHGGAAVVIAPVGIGDDGIEAIVAAGELDDDEDGVFAGGGHNGAAP